MFSGFKTEMSVKRFCSPVSSGDFQMKGNNTSVSRLSLDRGQYRPAKALTPSRCLDKELIDKCIPPPKLDAIAEA